MIKEPRYFDQVPTKFIYLTFFNVIYLLYLHLRKLNQFIELKIYCNYIETIKACGMIFVRHKYDLLKTFTQNKFLLFS